MSESKPPPSTQTEEEHRANLLALVVFLREMANQLVEQGQMDEARRFVDILGTLEAKTKGNVGDEEVNALEGVLFQLRMAIVRGKTGGASEAGPAGASGPDSGSTDSGSTDSGSTDAGSTDPGATDAGAGPGDGGSGGGEGSGSDPSPGSGAPA